MSEKITFQKEEYILEDLRVPELKALAEKMGIEGAVDLNREPLVEAIIKKASESAQEEDLVGDVLDEATKETSSPENLSADGDAAKKEAEKEAKEEKEREEKLAEKARLEAEKAKKEKKEVKYLIIAGAVSLNGNRIARSGEVYPEGAFQSRTVSDLVKNNYIKKYIKKK